MGSPLQDLGINSANFQPSGLLSDKQAEVKESTIKRGKEEMYNNQYIKRKNTRQQNSYTKDNGIQSAAGDRCGCEYIMRPYSAATFTFLSHSPLRWRAL